MIQVPGLPPNYEEILKVFPAAAGYDVLFSFGELIYSRNTRPISQELLDHERIHGTRQTEAGVDRWWKSYLEDTEFRRNEELLAHIAEYQSFCGRNRDRNARNGYLTQIAARFAGPLYGLGTTVKQARQLIVDKYR